MFPETILVLSCMTFLGFFTRSILKNNSLHSFRDLFDERFDFVEVSGFAGVTEIIAGHPEQFVSSCLKG